jgi:hypothetical protein
MTHILSDWLVLIILSRRWRRRAGRTLFDPEGASSAGSRDIGACNPGYTAESRRAGHLQATSMVAANEGRLDHRFAQA